MSKPRSTRRAVGEWVKLPPNVGFVGESDRLPAQIQDDGNEPCLLCDDPDCVEWATLWTAPDPQAEGKRHALYHVPECQMEDAT